MIYFTVSCSFVVSFEKLRKLCRNKIGNLIANENSVKSKILLFTFE